MQLLTQNAELRPLGIFNWTLPALTAKVDGKIVKVCPNAGSCALFCYAKTGTYMFSNVKKAHTAKLKMVMDDPQAWKSAMLEEMKARRVNKIREPHLPWLSRSHLSDEVSSILESGGAIIRIHDSGDFFAEWYLDLWIEIASERPDILFYAYTKEVQMVKSKGELPPNLLICFSMGGKQDRLIDTSEGGDRHAEVFPSESALEEADYYDQEDHDLLCVVAPSTRVGIVANNIPHVNKRLDGRTFGEAELDIRPI